MTLRAKHSPPTSAIAIALSACMTMNLAAQVPATTDDLTRSSQRVASDGTGQRGTRYCTIADYADPTAQCIPAEANSQDYYNDDRMLDNRAGLAEGADLGGYALRAGGASMASTADRVRPPAPANFEREPMTEYQRYVAGAVGQVMPIYGASLFQKVPDTFAPLDRSPVSSTYVIAPGDEMQVTVWGQINFSRRLIVGRTGELAVPDAGPIAVAGLTYAQAGAVLKSAMTHLYKNFDLSVTLGRLHSIQVFVVGEARRPGTYTVSSLSTMVNAVFACGGPSSHGSMRHIELRRGDRLVRDFDLYDLLLRGDKSNDAQLEAGDVIMIRPAGARVAVTGSVERAGIYELKGPTDLGGLLQLSDGLSPVAAAQEALIQRVSNGSTLNVVRVSLDDGGMRAQIKNGDIVRVLPLVPRFENVVTLRGNVANPARLPWHAGMLLSELIPTKEVLLTRDYWKQKNVIPDSGIVASDRDPFSDSIIDDGGRPTSPAASVRSDRDHSGAVLVAANDVQPLYRDQVSNVRGDTSFGAATGVDGVPSIRTFVPRNSIQPAAPDINWEYASIERVDQGTLATRIIPFRLGKLVLDHDAGADLPLEPGDVVTVFSKADFAVPRSQQPIQVRLEGEVARAGAYSVLPGETLRELVARAGGVTRNAYLFGAQFTRESTRREQQKRYEDFLNQFEREVNEAASNLSSRVTSVQQAATAQTSVSSQRDLIERLRQVAMNGRIVLDLQPNSQGDDSLPNLPLEHGDRLYIPSRPSTVNVIGTVAEQSSFLYEEDLRTGDYLEKAGGPARSADKNHMFIIRADGSVVSRNTHVALFAKSFDGLAMYPGDTLIVPTFINKSTFVRDLMDWSQVFSNLALGAAAVNVLH
jgi:polysaccharide export outer membrane protein